MTRMHCCRFSESVEHAGERPPRAPATCMAGRAPKPRGAPRSRPAISRDSTCGGPACRLASTRMKHRSARGRWAAGLGAALALTSASAMADCTTVTSQSIAFGTYSALSGTPIDSTGSVRITCTGSGLLGADNGVVSISAGSSTSFTNRTLVNGGQRLFYNLYTDAARSRVFGDGTGNTGTVGFTAGGGLLGGPSTATVPVYGRMPARQDVAPGQYIDTLIVTVTY